MEDAYLDKEYQDVSFNVPVVGGEKERWWVMEQDRLYDCFHLP